MNGDEGEKIQRNYFYSSGKKEKLLLFLREINAKRRLVVSTRVPSKRDAREKRGVHKSGLTGSSFRFRNECMCVHARAWTSLSNPLIGSAF